MSADKPGDTPAHETDFAAMWSSDGATRSLSPTASATGLPTDLPFLFSAGQRFGPYLIVRPLGKGGMGQVYEAEETDSGRRVAMKILSRGLGDDEERERFLREGRLAASLSHPNVVYVFGTSEVQGFPVIAMELAPAGTLKDLMVAGTPMPVSTAVDAVLQVIAGLEAAASIGILHRDIKPSNCFVHHDGRVMVGDFGLSMTTLARDEQTLTLAGTILGTPGFASPEQLRGGALDLRSDIYAVGATIYYLLTGRAPFDDPNIVSLITRVATEPAPALTSARPDIAGRLGSVVAKCLAKKPAERYASYAALAAALEPFRTAALAPAPLGRRFMAGFVDSYAAALPLMPFNMFMGARLLSLENRGEAALLALPSVASILLYYSVLEGRFGCGLGKAMLNLRVIDAAQAAPGVRRAFLRALVFAAPAQVATQVFGFVMMRSLGGPAREAGNVTLSLVGLGSVLLSFICLAILFSTARRRNGFAAMHDRVSRTRVVLRPKAIEARQSSQRAAAGMVSAPDGACRIGPYVVTDAVKAMTGSITDPLVADGYDDRLRRRVWIELLPAGMPPVPAWRRDLGRAARARWLSGRRNGAECWDAYEAMEGRPLAKAITAPQPWSRVRHWLADLSQEIAAGLKDGSLPALRPDRIWITNDDRARLLDWPPPSRAETERASAGLRPPAPSDTERASAGLRPDPDPRSSTLDPRSAQQFLYGVAAGALRGVDPDIARQEPPSTPLPLPARALVLSLREGVAGPPETVEARASATLRDAAVFPRRNRLLQLAVCSILPFTMVIAVLASIKMQVRSQTANPAAYELKACLSRLVSLDRKGADKLTAEERDERDLIEIYIAEHLREAAEDTAGYARAFPAISSIQKEYRMAERALANHPHRSAEQVQKADAVVAKVLVNQSRGLAAMNKPMVLWGVLGLIAGGAAVFAAVLGLIGAVATRGGFTFRAFGAALVLADGRDASRLRALARALVAWSPLALWLVMLKFTPKVQETTPAIALLYTLVLATLAAGAAWAWMHPSRGIQDRIAGTWIVPR